MRRGCVKELASGPPEEMVGNPTYRVNLTNGQLE